MANQIRVLIVDDSALIRSLLRELIEEAPDMMVVGAAPDPYVARDMIKRLHPDVVTLDVEMPRMNGLAFLERLMALRPTRVLMVSTMTQAGSDIAMRALELGAIDVVAKPQIEIETGMREIADLLHEKIRATFEAKLRPNERSANQRVHKFDPPHASTERIIAIGASTGGTEAIAALLREMPANAPAIVITQHMPPIFTASFARRLDRECRIRVLEGEDGARLLPGHAYISPGGLHTRVKRVGSNYTIALSDDAPVNRHRPAVDVLCASVARAAGANAVGAILTGMGSDGAAGLLEMRRAGSFTVAQDEATSVIFGMPRAACDLGAVTAVLPLHEIAGTLLKAAASRTLVYRT